MNEAGAAAKLSSETAPTALTGWAISKVGQKWAKSGPKTDQNEPKASKKQAKRGPKVGSKQTKNGQKVD